MIVIKGIGVILAILIISVLSGCGNQQVSLDEFIVDEVEEGDFIYRLMVEKEEFREGEPVRIYSELEYIGDEESIEIYHSITSAFRYIVKEKTNNYELHSLRPDVATSVTLKPGEPLREEYDRDSGGYNEDRDSEAFIEFVKHIWEQDSFPSGSYVFEGKTNFYMYLDEEAKERRFAEDMTFFHLEAKVEFEVK